MASFMIEAPHSKWGVVKLEAKKHRYKSTEGEEFVSYLLFYAGTGTWMGELDPEMGGILGHPNEHTQKFLMSLQDLHQDSGMELHELDEEGYIELETIIEDAIRAKDPHFFTIPRDDGLDA